MLCFTHPLLPISLNLLGGSYDLVIFMPSVTKAQSVCTLEGNKKKSLIQYMGSLTSFGGSVGHCFMEFTVMVPMQQQLLLLS